MITYLNYGPFSSFAPQYDSTWATLSKRDSDLLLRFVFTTVYLRTSSEFVISPCLFVYEFVSITLSLGSDAFHLYVVNRSVILVLFQQG